MKLLQFLKQTSEDQQAMLSYHSDPEAAMQKAGLTDEEKDAVRSADRAKIASLIEPDAEVGALLNVKVTVHLTIT